MRIECPTCSIGFNVSDEQIGQKGLCPRCETKFIIPADPGDEIEVLAEGKVESAAAAKSEAPRDEKSAGSKRSEKRDSEQLEKSEQPKPRSERKRDDDDDDDLDRRRRGEQRKREREIPEKKRRDSTRLLEDDDDGDDDDDEFDAGGAGKALGLLAIGLVIGLAVGFALGRMTAGGNGTNGEGGSKVEAAGDTKDPFGLGTQTN